MDKEQRKIKDSAMGQSSGYLHHSKIRLKQIQNVSFPANNGRVDGMECVGCTVAPMGDRFDLERNMSTCETQGYLKPMEGNLQLCCFGVGLLTDQLK